MPVWPQDRSFPASVCSANRRCQCESPWNAPKPPDPGERIQEQHRKRDVKPTLRGEPGMAFRSASVPAQRQEARSRLQLARAQCQTALPGRALATVFCLQRCRTRLPSLLQRHSALPDRRFSSDAWKVLFRLFQQGARKAPPWGRPSLANASPGWQCPISCVEDPLPTSAEPCLRPRVPPVASPGSCRRTRPDRR